VGATGALGLTTGCGVTTTRLGSIPPPEAWAVCGWDAVDFESADEPSVAVSSAIAIKAVAMTVNIKSRIGINF